KGLSVAQPCCQTRDKRNRFMQGSRMLLGYARVSKAEAQDAAGQVAALRASGCDRIYQEAASGSRWDRPELRRLLDQLRPQGQRMIRPSAA
ncbi:MAG TPA: recombinase family protein, partial [Azonexus sp.]|nr:recombinase family protein [Azonexus sp.]